MTEETKRALMRLRKVFPQPWVVSIIEPPEYRDRCYARAQFYGKRVPDFAAIIEGECAPTPAQAVDDLLRVWREIVTGVRREASS